MINWIKNDHKTIPDVPEVHIRLNTFSDDGINYDIRYYQSPKDWDWYTQSGVQITYYALVIKDVE